MGLTMVLPWVWPWVLPWFYHGFTMVLPCLYHGFYHGFTMGFTMVLPGVLPWFLWLYHGCTMVLPWFYHGFTVFNHCFTLFDLFLKVFNGLMQGSSTTLWMRRSQSSDVHIDHPCRPWVLPFHIDIRSPLRLQAIEECRLFDSPEAMAMQCGRFGEVFNRYVPCTKHWVSWYVMLRLWHGGWHCSSYRPLWVHEPSLISLNFVP